jgi:hypothetical protein
VRLTLLLLCCAPAWLPAQTLTPDQLREDFRILRSALEEGHPGIYRYTSKPDLDRIFDGAAARLTKPMSALEFYRIAAPAVAALKCGHTSLQLSREIQQALAGEPLLPFDVAILNGKIYVFRDYTDDAPLAGVEIRSINGVPASRILATLLAVQHGDGDSATAGPLQLGRNRTFARQIYTLLGLENPFTIQYTLKGKTVEAPIDGLFPKQMTQAAQTRYPQDRRPAVSTFKLANAGKTGVLKIVAFGGNGEGNKPLGNFFEDVFKELSEKKVPSLIIDVRDNGGGEDELGKKLFSYLASEPFPYYRDLLVNKLSFDFFRYSPNFQGLPPEAQSLVKKGADGKYHVEGHPNWGVQQPTEPHFAGKVLALMNGGSFSTTCEFLSTLHHHHRATFLGEEAGGGYYGNTSGMNVPIVLPHSKLMLPINLVGYYMAIDGTEHGSRSIQPDQPVEYTIDDLLAGKDKAVELALRLAAAK